jgi:tetratricopeptide (TPR) repeat protein
MGFSKQIKANVWLLMLVMLIPGNLKAQERDASGLVPDFMTRAEDLEDLVRTGTASLTDIRSQLIALQGAYEVVSEIALREQEGTLDDLPPKNGVPAWSREDLQKLRARLIHKATPAQLERMWTHAYTAAITFHNAQQYNLAAQKLRDMMDRYTSSLQGYAEAAFYLGENLNAQGHYSEARKAYEKAAYSKNISLKQNATLRLMELDLQDKAYDASVKRYEALERSSDRMDLLAAEIYLILGDWKKTRQAIGKIGPDSPLYSRALLLEARYYQRKKGPEASLKFLTKIYDFVSEKEDAALAIGQLCYQLGRWQDAIHYYSTASPSSPNYARTILGIGWAQMDEGEHVESITTASQVLFIGARSDLSFEGWALIGHNYKLLGDYDQARQWFDLVLREEKKNATYLEYIQNRIRLEEMSSELQFIRGAVSGGNYSDFERMLRVNVAGLERLLKQLDASEDVLAQADPEMVLGGFYFLNGWGLREDDAELGWGHWARREIAEVLEAVERWVRYCEFELVDVAFLETTKKAQINQSLEAIDRLLERSTRKAAGR